MILKASRHIIISNTVQKATQDHHTRTEEIVCRGSVLPTGGVPTRGDAGSVEAASLARQSQ